MIAHSHFFITDLCISLTNPWLTTNDHLNHKPMVDLWLPPNQPLTITAMAQGEQTMAAQGGQWPHSHSCDLNQPTATRTIWSHPRQFMVIWTHPRPHTTIWTLPTMSHNHHRPTKIWIPCQSEAYKLILRERRSFHCERKRGDNVGEREVKRKRRSLGGRESVIKKWTFSLQSHEQWGCIYATSL